MAVLTNTFSVKTSRLGEWPITACIDLHRQSRANASIGFGGKFNGQIVHFLHLRFQYGVPKRDKTSHCKKLQCTQLYTV